jgi:hypothetical protein
VGDVLVSPPGHPVVRIRRARLGFIVEVGPARGYRSFSPWGWPYFLWNLAIAQEKEREAIKKRLMAVPLLKR